MRGMIACPQPRAADVGVDILARGGNAFDAAIATAFAQMVVDPFMCGVGGMGTSVVHDARTGETSSIDFHNRAGSLVTEDMWAGASKGRTEVSGYSLFDDYRSELGHTAIMTPGTVAGFEEMHRRHATLPWAELLRPAARIARDGYELPPFVLDFWSRKPAPGVPDGITRLRASQACADIYLHPEARLYEVGDLIRNPDYADTIDAIAEDGAEIFYRGNLARRIAEDLSSNGGYVTAEDLASYRPRLGAPVRARFRDYEVVSNPPPGSGVCLIQMLQILEKLNLGDHPHGSAEHLDLLSRTMAFSHHDRNRWLMDPEFGEVPVHTFLDEERNAGIAQRIRDGEWPGLQPENPPSCTTHLCVMDEQGNAVSVTHTLGTGCGVVTPGLGFVYNNSMKLADPLPGRPNSLAPGKARTTGMVPTMLLKDGKPVLIAGALGGSVIISAVLQAIVNVVEFDLTPMEAVTVPRIHHEGGALLAEARILGREVERLRAKGHEVRHLPSSFDPIMARVHVIATDGQGGWRGGADPRSGAAVAEVW